MRDDYFKSKIYGFFTWPRFYDDMVEKFPSGSSFVEVGVLEGSSLSHLILRIIESGKDISVIAVDWFYDQSGKSLDKFNSNMSLVRDKFDLIISSSVDASQRFEDKSLDFVFIDASHDYESVKADILAWIPKVKMGGIIAGHDYIETYPGVIMAVNEIFGERVNLEYSKNGEACWLIEIIE